MNMQFLSTTASASTTASLFYLLFPVRGTFLFNASIFCALCHFAMTLVCLSFSFPLCLCLSLALSLRFRFFVIATSVCSALRTFFAALLCVNLFATRCKVNLAHITVSINSLVSFLLPQGPRERETKTVRLFYCCCCLSCWPRHIVCPGTS